MIENDKLSRRKYYMDYITDIMLDISQTSYWRSLLFNSKFNEKYFISKDLIDKIPDYVKKAFLEYDLKFYISKVTKCPDEFDSGLVIFKLEAYEYPDITRYSGNNSDVI